MKQFESAVDMPPTYFPHRPPVSMVDKCLVPVIVLGLLAIAGVFVAPMLWEHIHSNRCDAVLLIPTVGIILWCLFASYYLLVLCDRSHMNAVWWTVGVLAICTITWRLMVLLEVNKGWICGMMHIDV